MSELHDFTVGVGQQFDEDHFDPAEFSTCINYSGDPRHGGMTSATCTEVHKGRYVSLSMPADGIVRAETDQKVLSLCLFDVRGRPGNWLPWI